MLAVARTDKSCILQCALWKRWYGVILCRLTYVYVIKYVYFGLGVIFKLYFDGVLFLY